MFFLCLLRNDLLIVRSTGLSAVWATTARSHRQKMSHFIFSKVGKEFTNLITL